MSGPPGKTHNSFDRPRRPLFHNLKERNANMTHEIKRPGNGIAANDSAYNNELPDYEPPRWTQTPGFESLAIRRPPRRVVRENVLLTVRADVEAIVTALRRSESAHALRLAEALLDHVENHLAEQS